MAKAKSFVDKLSKASKIKREHCPECGEVLTTIKLITSEKSQKSGAWRFNQKFINICKCNQKEITG